MKCHIPCTFFTLGVHKTGNYVTNFIELVMAIIVAKDVSLRFMDLTELQFCSVITMSL